MSISELYLSPDLILNNLYNSESVKITINILKILEMSVEEKELYNKKYISTLNKLPKINITLIICNNVFKYRENDSPIFVKVKKIILNNAMKTTMATAIGL